MRFSYNILNGSAFTKAKPKHGFLTVTRQAVLRLFLLPFYYHWWICQTSSRIFIALLVLYGLQLLNTFLYFSTWFPFDTLSSLDSIPPSEVLVPFAMMLVLSIIHSQIVSTHSANGCSKKQELLNNTYTRRTKRTRRRNTSVSKIRQTHFESKTNPEGSFDSSNSLSEAKYNKRSRVKIVAEENTRKTRRTVVWDTTPIKSQSKCRTCLEHEDSRTVSIENNFGVQVPQRRASFNEIEQIGGIDRMQVPEADEETQVPVLDDDGFESLDGNGSSDSNKEEQDISLTAEEYETVLKNSPVHGDQAVEKKLVFKTCCPTNFKQKDNISLSKSSRSTIFESLPLNTSDVDQLTVDDDCIQITPLEDKKTAWRANCSSSTTNVENANDNVNNLNFGLGEQNIDEEDRQYETDIDGSGSEPVSETSVHKKRLLTRRRGSQQNLTVSIKSLAESSYNSSGDESEEGGTLSSPSSFCNVLTEGTTSATEWVGVTTNSEECSYSSEIDGSDHQISITSDSNEHPFAWEMEMMPNNILSPSCAPVGKVSCTMWEKKEVKKANLSVLDISSAIIARVEEMPENVDYFYFGVVMSMALAVIPCACRLADSLYDNSSTTRTVDSKFLIERYCPAKNFSTMTTVLSHLATILRTCFGSSSRENTIVAIAVIERFCLAAIFFFLLTVAERTFKQRFLYAKFFSHLTSFRRARKSELPHFRLNKVRNIKSWLSVRSYLKKRGPQRSVDVIVSTAFLITVILLSFLSVELLKDSEYNVEAVGWCIVIGFFMLRFMTLGTKINRKYRNLSTLITEQINLYLQIEQKPNKKEELMVANSVLKLAADLLKELESPFKISGLSANPYLYTLTKVVMLSALSGILSEFLGFKLKLHKIKIK